MLSLLRGAGFAVVRSEDERSDVIEPRIGPSVELGRAGSVRLTGEVCNEDARSGDGVPLSNTNVGIDSNALDKREPFGGRVGRPLFGLGEDGSPILAEGGRKPESLT